MDGANLTFVGIDVAKATLDPHFLPSGQSHSVPNSPAGFRQLRKLLPAPADCRIVLEATGGYERQLVADLLDAGYHVAVVNPKRVRDFARALGLVAKTDRLDARVLALFTQKVQPAPAQKTPEKQAEIQQLVLRRSPHSAWQTLQSRPHRLHAKAPRHRQLAGQVRPNLEPQTRLLTLDNQHSRSV